MRKTGAVFYATAVAMLSVASAFGAYASAVDIKTIQDRYVQRQQQNLQWIADSEDESMERGAALLFLGGDLDRANELVRTFDSLDGGPLQCSLALRLLHAFPSKDTRLKPDVRERLETQLALWIQNQSFSFSPTLPPDRAPEYTDILETSILLLWADRIDEATPGYRWPDKKNKAERKERLRQNAKTWLERRIQYGFVDRFSPKSYYTLVALLNLRDGLQDAPSLVLADSALDTLVADMALESLQNQWGGVHCRDLESIYSLPGNRIQNMLFGWPVDEESFVLDDALIIPFCDSSYRPPSVLVRLAREHSNRGIYEMKNRFCRNPLEPNDRPIHKYTYVTPSYILSSFQLRDESVPWQSRSWDLMVMDGRGTGHHLFTIAGNELASGAISAMDKEFYSWNASCYQYKNVLFGRFGRCDRKRSNPAAENEFIDERYAQLPTRVWIPNVFIPVTEEGGWWFCRLDTVYLAFRPLSGRSYWWRTSDDGGASEDGVSILTFQDLFTSFLLEVENASNFTSFEDFKEQIGLSPLEIDNDVVTFVSRRGDVFLFPLDDGDFLVNGRPVNLSDGSEYQLFNSPFIQSKYGSGVLKAEWQSHSLTIDVSDPQNPKRTVVPN